MAEHILYDKRRLCFTEVTDFTDFQGIGREPLYKRYDTVYSVVEKNIAPEYRDFFAQPVYSSEDDQISWFVREWKVAPCTYNNLDSDEKAKYDVIKDKTLAEYTRVKNTLFGEDKQILAAALRCVDESFMFCYDDKVVVVAWGMSLDKNKHVSTGSVIHDLAIRNMYKIRFSAGEHGRLENALADIIKRPEEHVMGESDFPQIIPNPGYLFKGWGPNASGAKVTGHMGFTAQYEKAPEMINAAFDAAGHGTIIGNSSYTILKGTAVPSENIPTVQPDDNYEFTHWEPSVDTVRNSDTVFFAKYRKLRINCLFDPGEHGTIEGETSFVFPQGASMPIGLVPQVKCNKGYRFKGWNISPENFIFADDTVFVAQYEDYIPWYKRLWRYLKWLLYFLLLLLLLFLLGTLFKDCSCVGHRYVGGEGLNDRDSTWIHEDPNVGKGGIYDPYDPYQPNPTPPEYSDVLPPQEGVLPPIDGEPEIQPGNPTVLADRLNILMENTDKSVMDLAREFKNAYPEDEYQVIYYDDVVKRLQITCPPARRNQMKEEIPARFPSYRLFVFDEALFELQAVPVTPGDPAFSDSRQSWYFDVIRAKEGWGITMGDDRICVAIVDNGFNLKHPELAPKVVSPYNVWTHTGRTFPLEIDHGTHVAGTALALANNDEGISGIAPNCKFLPVQVADENNMMTTTSILDGVLYAIYQGADVVNVSLGANFAGLDALDESDQQRLINNHFKEEERLWMEVSRIAATHWTTLVFAAGNNNVLAGIDALHRPSDVIVVSAIQKEYSDFNKADFSNYGKHSTISAPGESIYSTVGKKDYAYMDGTSMAAPIITGTVALLKSVNDSLTTRNIICALRNSGLDTDGKIGRLVQVDKALESVMSGDYVRCRPIPTSGDVQVLLSWDNYNDIDLSCVDPNGEVISFSNKISRSGGRLEIDMNVGYPGSITPIENIYWPTGGAPQGTYDVYVHFFHKHPGDVRTPYKVKVVYGTKTKHYDGILTRSGERVKICSFNLGTPSRSSGSDNRSGNAYSDGGYPDSGYGGGYPDTGSGSVGSGSGTRTAPAPRQDDDDLSLLERERRRLRDELNRVNDQISRIRNSRRRRNGN